MKLNKISALIYALSVCLLSFSATYDSAHSLQPQASEELSKGEKQTDGKQKNRSLKRSIKEEREIASRSEVPVYTQIEFDSLVGETFINPRFIGRISTVRKLTEAGLLERIPILNVKETEDGWQNVFIPSSESDAAGFVVTGTGGSLKVSLREGNKAAGVNKLRPLGSEIVIAFGELSATLIAPFKTADMPGGFEISVLDFGKNKLIRGSIVAIKDDQLAVRFENLPLSVVNKEGMIRISLKKPEGSFLGADLKAWGYDIFVSDTEVEKSAAITGRVFGLGEGERVKFTFQPLPGQNIIPSAATLTVKEINQNTSLANITTSIPGSQPISVLVEAINSDKKK